MWAQNGGPSRADDEDYGFRFNQLSMNEYIPYPVYQPYPPVPYHQTPFIPYQQWAPRSPIEEWQYHQTSVRYQAPYQPPVRKVERKAYHPQPPAKRSDWVMWVGNVPQNTTHEELWSYFNNIPGEEWKGPSSIFLISRSSCAFVNLSSQQDLDRAVKFFNGRPLRGWDVRCPRLVCRVRLKDDDLKAGVGAQRGMGMHREWIGGEQTSSYASTNSSFLVQHFPKRIFILKSTSVAELEESVRTGMWRTQRHNEPILDRAFRTAPEVYLVFGANKAGEFFGYAKMVEAINRPVVSTPSSSSSIPVASPSQLSGTEDEFPLPHHRHSHENPPAPPLSTDHRPATLDPKLLQQSSLAGSIAAMRATERNAHLNEGHDKPVSPKVDDGVLRKDTLVKPDEGIGSEFRIEWVKVGSLPFGRTRHLRNPWNADREVKVSRDGTEVEPHVGSMLLAEWK